MEKMVEKKSGTSKAMGNVRRALREAELNTKTRELAKKDAKKRVMEGLEKAKGEAPLKRGTAREKYMQKQDAEQMSKDAKKKMSEKKGNADSANPYNSHRY